MLVLLGMNQRNGTDVDAANVSKVFTKLGYKARVYNDQTVKQMKSILSAGECDAKLSSLQDVSACSANTENILQTAFGNSPSKAAQRCCTF